MFHFVEFYRIKVSESVLISAPQGEGYGCSQRGLSVHSSFCFCLSIDRVIARCPKYKNIAFMNAEQHFDYPWHTSKY